MMLKYEEEPFYLEQFVLLEDTFLAEHWFMIVPLGTSECLLECLWCHFVESFEEDWSFKKGIDTFL